MGSAKSIPVTPVRAPPHKHLAQVADPRSPSAGIQSTPIQVESFPQSNLPAGEQLKGPKQAQDSDLRSPTLGIAWTPMKTSSADPQSPLVKELSEVFETEASKSNLPSESFLPLGLPSSSELDLPLDTQLSLEDQMLRWNDPELPSKQVSSQEDARNPAETPVASQSSDNPSKDPESPRSSGSKTIDGNQTTRS
ncbi:Cell division cycle-associated protein 3 [Sciurus carolinensis]|uniref:Cell division cycle-associated protein 3 n=1 Tax=Sciurus carolinensis TaxID=30640 RepID=A0AA41NIW3_SCICA|nr:Cell division cycle-associated protein 3 [Sciurus carolinensis]